MQEFIRSMRSRKLSEATIQKRVELISRLRDDLDGVALLDATPEMLFQFQATFAHLAPASVHIYTRHMTAFYRWAKQAKLITEDPAVELMLPRVPKTIPHPTHLDDLRTIFAVTQGRIRTAYLLAAFAGLRSGEICRARSTDISVDVRPTMLVHGKGGKERRVVLLPPVMDEISYRRGWLITRDDGKPVDPLKLSGESTRFLKSMGIPSTLHSMRAAFATHAVRLTHDVLLVRDLLGHESLNTTQIYVESDLEGAHEKLAGVTQLAQSLLSPVRLAAVASA